MVALGILAAKALQGFKEKMELRVPEEILEYQAYLGTQEQLAIQVSPDKKVHY